MAQAVVHELEVVEVHDDDPDRGPDLAGSRDGDLEHLRESVAVGQTRELVVEGEVRELLLGFLPFRDVLDHRDRELRVAVIVALKRRRDVPPQELPVLAGETPLLLVRVAGAGHHLPELLIVHRELGRTPAVRQDLGSKLLDRVAEHPYEGGVRVEELSLPGTPT